MIVEGGGAGQPEFGRAAPRGRPAEVVRRGADAYNRAWRSAVPELPEVETVVRELRPRLTGRRFLSVACSRCYAAARRVRGRARRPWQPTWGARLLGSRVEAVRRRGKWVVLELNGPGRLVFHLGMTGQLAVAPADAPAPPHTHLRFALSDGWNELRFRDARRFGSATLFSDDAALEAFFARSRLGPEPFDVAAADWRGRLAATARPLKAVLLDQRFVAGVGNIYADEALFAARLHPARPGRGLGAAEADRLRRAVGSVLRRAIARRGTDLGDGVVVGAYETRVYGRAGKPCPRCRAAVERVRLAGRSTHFCPRCQRPAARSGPPAVLRPL
jgi:formamidopyrimidine-DNA glycosylase